jgi:hypothetical protein
MLEQDFGRQGDRFVQSLNTPGVLLSAHGDAVDNKRCSLRFGGSTTSQVPKLPLAHVLVLRNR